MNRALGAQAPFYDSAQVHALLDLAGCIEAVRAVMIELSASDRPSPLRQIVTLEPGRLFGVMPGDAPELSTFGAKLVSVFADSSPSGGSRHQGVVVAYDRATGAVRCIADAEAVTGIRTACATAAATDALARPDARTLLVFGTGLQAQAHLRALPLVRSFREIRLWGRRFDAAERLAKLMTNELGVPVRATDDPLAAAGSADVICTTTSAPEPILLGDWVRPGTHINLVGSSYLGPAEVDPALVAKARYIADHRASVLAQASELANARNAGLVDNAHVAAEIGEVFAGRVQGRESDDQITIYKSLGHIVQDLAATAYVHRRACAGS